jgi:hypothetical protein
LRRRSQSARNAPPSLYGAGRKYLRPDVDPVADLIAERVQDDDAVTARP